MSECGWVGGWACVCVRVRVGVGVGVGACVCACVDNNCNLTTLVL